MSVVRQETVTVGSRAVKVRELTVAEVRAWLQRAEEHADEALAEPFDLVGELLLDGLTLAEVALMTDLEVEAMELLTPSALQELVDKCREVNPHFFGLRERLLRVAAAGPGVPSRGSTPGSADSSDSATPRS